MNRVKAALLFAVVMMTAGFAKAQSLEDGKKFFYYEKFKSARATFEKLLAANPANADAAYWLGLTMITGDEYKDLPAAKEIFRKALEASPNNALLIAGMGHIELHEGKKEDARNRFETAISLSGAKSIPVFNAIGVANADYDSKNGDAAYAIEKLKQATTVKGFKDPETYCLLGDAYRKFIDGGSAIQAYQNAIAINDKYARAYYRIGKVYQTQGITQEDIYMKYYNDAMKADPNYAPVYNNLFNLYYSTDIIKAGDYLDKYLNIMGDDEPKACYYRASVKYAQGLYQEAISKSDECIAAAGASPYIKLYLLKAYAHNKLKDSVNAKNNFEVFFKSAKDNEIGPTDLKTYADILLKFPGNEALAGTYVDKAVALDSTEAGKVTLLRSVATGYEAQKNYAAAAEWYKKILDVRKNPTKTDIFNTANNFSRGGNFQAAIDNWAVYISKYPNETYGYYMTGVTQNKLDTTGALAAPSYQKVIDLGEAQWGTDSVKVKAHLQNAYKFFIQYAYNVQKDKKAASDYCAKYLVHEPNDAEVQGFKKIFDNPATKVTPATPAPPATPAKPATGSGKPSNGGTSSAAGNSKTVPAAPVKPATTPKKK